MLRGRERLLVGGQAGGDGRVGTGEVNTVLYHLLPAMLLNEVQKQHGQMEAQARQMQTQQEQLQAQAAQLAELRARLEGLVARLTAC